MLKKLHNLLHFFSLIVVLFLYKLVGMVSGYICSIYFSLLVLMIRHGLFSVGLEVLGIDGFPC